MSNSTKVEGRKLFEAHYSLVEELIRYVSRRHRLGVDEREDFTSYAMWKLVENDYARLRKYRGDSSFKTYLTVVMQRLFLDYRTQKWGKWRPSTAALRLGATAVQLETLLYRDGIDFHEAREMLLTGADSAVSAEELWELAIQLPRRERPRRVEEEVLHNVGVLRQDDDAERSEKAALVRALERRLAAESHRLPDEDRHLLRMRFEEGMSVPEIADVLGHKPKALYARIGRLLKRLRLALETSGVSWDELEDVVRWREMSLDLDRVFGSPPNHPALSV